MDCNKNFDGYLDIACDDILKLIDENQDYLFLNENLKILAYILWRWLSLYKNSGIVYNKHFVDIKPQCNNTIEDELSEGHVINYKSKNNFKLLQKACKTIIAETHLTHSNQLINFIKTNEYFDSLEKPIYDDWDNLYWKQNKTFDEWVTLLSNKKHKNHPLYTSVFFIYNHLLCSASNGFKWNKNGFIDTTVDIALFKDFYYSKDELPIYIKTKLFEILNRDECQYVNKKAWEIIEEKTNNEINKRLNNSNIITNFKNNKSIIPSNKELLDFYLKEIDKMVLNRANKEVLEKYEISRHTKFLNPPDKIDKSYINAIRFIVENIFNNKSLYTDEELNLVKTFIKKHPYWFRKTTIDKLLKS